MNIIQCGKLMYERGYVRGTAGNISVRKDWGIAITGSGKHIGLLEDNSNHIIHIDKEGKIKSVTVGKR